MGLAGVHVTFVRGARDRYRDPARKRPDHAPEELGVRFSVLVFPGGHEIAPGPLRDVARAGLREE